MANALPLLLVGGAALLLMGKKKKAPANGKEAAEALEPLPATTKYPPESGKVFEALNVIQAQVAANDQDYGIALFYDPDNPISVGFRTMFGHIAKDNPDVIFIAIPLSFGEYVVAERPEAAAGDLAAYVDALKSGAYAAIIDASGHDAGVKSDPAKFTEEMAIALEETRKEIKRGAEEG